MKWEIQLYAGLCFLIVILYVHQSNLFNIENEKTFSEVNTINSFNQLMVDLECNIYLLEGESQNIIMEGPSDKLNNIETIYHEGRITIRENGEKLLSRFLDFFNKNKTHINIYITVNSLENFTINQCNEQPIYRYFADDLIGLSLKYGNTLVLEPKKTKTCV